MRRDLSLQGKYQAIAAYSGIAVTVVGAAMIVPLVVLAAWPHEWPIAGGLAGLGATTVLLGLVVYRKLRPLHTLLSVREGGVLVVVSWGLACLLGAIPFMCLGGLTFTGAVFESVSGWTTTGLSVVDVTTASKTILLFRSIIQLVGGAGFAVLMVATLIGPAGTAVTGAEGRTDQLVPHVRKSAKLVLTFYAVYGVLITGLYAIFGMNLFDAVNHACAAVSTGGFSTRPESIGHWNSPALEAVSILGMLLGQTSFVTAYLAATGNFKAAVRDGEVQYTAVAGTVSAAILLLGVTGCLYPTLGESVRVAVFEVASALTTTGFSTVTYSDWNALGIGVLMLLMFVGGGTYSTAGGLKQYRAYLLGKSLMWEIRRSLLPSKAVEENYLWNGGRKVYIRDDHVRQVAVFSFLYVAGLAIGTGILAAHGYSLPDAAFEFASAQGAVGLSVGVTRADAPCGVLWVLILGMFLGRLEFLVVLTGAATVVRDLLRLIR